MPDPSEQFIWQIRQARDRIASAKSRWNSAITFNDPHRLILDDLINALDALAKALEKLPPPSPH